MSKCKKEIIIYTSLCLLICNTLWYFAYSNQEADFSIFLLMIASFFPMFLTLVITKITKEGWDNLGIVFNLKRSWKIYLISILGTVFLVYLANPLLLLIFPKHISTTFTTKDLFQIAIMMLLGIGCFIECMGEELGWISYLFPRIEKLLGTTWGCVVLGVIRATWHLGILVFMEHPGISFFEILISNVCLQFFMVYMYKKSGSLFPCTISHGISNLMPIFLIYDKEWYYTHVLPIIIAMIPELLYAIFFYTQMKRSGLLKTPQKNESK